MSCIPLKVFANVRAVLVSCLGVVVAVVWIQVRFEEFFVCGGPNLLRIVLSWIVI
jgi:hypothetical protein